MRKISTEIDKINDETKQLAQDMVETMFANNGVGLAAPQVGVNIRLVVVDPRESGDDPDPQVFVNPSIENLSGLITMEEGCLSIPDIRSDIKRPKSFDFKAINLVGETIQFHADDLLARVILHEIDHLNGKLFVDYLTPVKKILIKEQLKALEKESAVLNR